MKSLAVKYRPNTFDDVVGQETTVKILKKVVEVGKPKNAYIFAGESGCGKTTLARIFAKALNQGIGEPIEIDAASNNGVDQIRDIIESANQRSLTGTYKIYIFDEAHMFSNSAENALLKIIEDPPTFTIFIFCTTDPNKLPQTLLNRMQRFNICKITASEIKQRLEYICTQEGFINYVDTCDLISKICNGCMRDAITLLDQCADYSVDLSLNNTKDILGSISQETMFYLTYFLTKKDESGLIAVLETLAKDGIDLRAFINNYLGFTLDIAKYILFKNNLEVTNIPLFLEDNIKQLITVQNLDWFNNLVDIVLTIKQAIKQDIDPKSIIEAYFIRFCRQ